MDAPDYRTMPIGVRYHFFDSGAFSMKAWARAWAKETGESLWAYYDTPAHWEYVDDYCRFVQRNIRAIDFFANVDAIGNPELSYRNQKFIEKEYGIEPVPVVHSGTPVRWLRKYIDEGYDYVGFGLTRDMTISAVLHWLDECFSVVCDTPDRLPRIRTHGFAITRFSLFFRYPWFSVDSKSWSDYGAYGGVLVPQWAGGRFVFDRNPYLMKIGTRSPYRAKAGYHYDNLPPMQKTLVKRWLDECGLPLGKSAPDGTVVERGAINDHCVRKDASIMVFEGMKAAVPKYPWAWRPKTLRGFH